MPSKALKKAIDAARDSAAQLPADHPCRHPFALLVGIVRRLSEENPEIEQPIAPEPPDAGTGVPVPPPAGTKPA